jgi:hypothetical protein
VFALRFVLVEDKSGALWLPEKMKSERKEGSKPWNLNAHVLRGHHDHTRRCASALCIQAGAGTHSSLIKVSPGLRPGLALTFRLQPLCAISELLTWPCSS